MTKNHTEPRQLVRSNLEVKLESVTDTHRLTDLRAVTEPALAGSPSRVGDVEVYKPTQLAHFFFFIFIILFLCLSLSLWPFQLYFIAQILPTTVCFQTLFIWSLFCLISPVNSYISL